MNVSSRIMGLIHLKRKSASNRFIRLGVIVLGLAVAALLGGYLYYRPLLIREPQLVVSYSVRGQDYDDGQVFSSMRASAVRFLYLPQAEQEFQWFGYDPKFEIVGQHPLTRDGLFGFNCTYPPVVGIALNNPKLESQDLWRISFRAGLPSFTSQLMRVDVSSR